MATLSNAKMFNHPLERGKFHAHIQQLAHKNGTIGTTKAMISLAGSNMKLFSVLIRNTHSTNDLQVSFDDSTNWFTIPATKSLSASADISYFYLKGSDLNTTYECLLGYEPTSAAS